MATSILRSPMLLRSLFFGPAKWPYIFVQKSLIMRSPTNMANSHILKSLTVDVFYNFTPLIRPLIQNRKIKMPVSCQFHWPSKLSLLFFLFLDYSTWVRMWCNWCICHLRFYLAPLVTGTDPGEGLAPSPLFLDQTEARRETAPTPPTLSKGPHSPQSAIHNRHSSLFADHDYHQSSNFEITSFFIRKNFLEIKLLGVITDLKPFNLVKKSEIRVTEMIWTF